MKKISLLFIILFISIFVKAQSQKLPGSSKGSAINHSVDMSENSSLSNMTIKLSVFPNPSSGHVTISFNSEAVSKYTLSVFDMIGKVKYNENILVSEGQNQRYLDLDNLVKGLYMVVIHTEGKNDLATRLIVE